MEDFEKYLMHGKANHFPQRAHNALTNFVHDFLMGSMARPPVGTGTDVGVTPVPTIVARLAMVAYLEPVISERQAMFGAIFRQKDTGALR